MQTNKTIAVVYHYYELNLTYKDNLIYFLSVGILNELSYFVVISGDCSIHLPEHQNVTYIYTENKNNDYGGYSNFFKKYNCSFDYLIFINSSMRGPFLPNYYNQPWYTPFIDKLILDTHLVGGSINFRNYYNEENFFEIDDLTSVGVHVQTTVYAITKEAAEYLNSKGFYSNEAYLSKDDVIKKYEIGLSSEILNNGWAITSILNDDKFVKKTNTAFERAAKSMCIGDVLNKYKYYSRTLAPEELIFIKTNRDMLTAIDLASHTYTSLFRVIKTNGWSEAFNLYKRSGNIVLAANSSRRLMKRFLRFFGLKSFANWLYRLI